MGSILRIAMCVRNPYDGPIFVGGADVTRERRIPRKKTPPIRIPSKGLQTPHTPVIDVSDDDDDDDTTVIYYASPETDETGRRVILI